MVYVTDTGWGSAGAVKQAVPQQGITATVTIPAADMARAMKARPRAVPSLKTMTAPDLAESSVQRRIEVWRLAKSGDQQSKTLWKQLKQWWPGKAQQARQAYKQRETDLAKARKPDVVKMQRPTVRKQAAPPVLTRQVADLQAQVAQSRRAVAGLRSQLEDMAVPRYAPKSLRPGPPASAVQKAASTAQGTLLTDLSTTWRTDPDPANRENAYKAITKMLGLP